MADNQLRISDVPHGLVVTAAGLDNKTVTRAADFVISQGVGEWEAGTSAGSRLPPSHDEIAQLAFHFYEARGRQDGHHIEDWLRAEQELAQRYR